MMNVSPAANATLSTWTDSELTMSTGLPEKTTPREDEELLLIEDTVPSAVDNGGKLRDKHDNKETEEIEEEDITTTDKPPATHREDAVDEIIVEEPYIPTGQARLKNVGKGTEKRDWKSKTAELLSSPPPSSSSHPQRLNATASAELMTSSKHTNFSASTLEISQVKGTQRGVDKENSKPEVVNADVIPEDVAVEGGKMTPAIQKERRSEELEFQEELSVDVNGGTANDSTGSGEAEIQARMQEQLPEHQNEREGEIQEQEGKENEEQDDVDEDISNEFDVSWMHKLKGKELLKEAEAIISTSMLCIDKVTSPPHWKEVLSENGEAFVDTNIPITTILEEWTRRFEHYPPYLPAALCLRFSKFYNSQFQPMLNAANQNVNPTDKIILIKRVWTEQMNPLKVKAFCDEKCLLSVPSMVSFFRTQDELMNIAECQLARLSSDPMYAPPKVTEHKDDDEVDDETHVTPASESQALLDPRNVELNPSESEKILERMGMVNMGVRLLEAIQARVLSCCKIYDAQHCTIGELIEYCTERGKMPVIDVHADSDSNAGTSKEGDHEEDKIRDQSGCLRNLLSTSATSPSLLQYTQAYMKKLSGKITVDTAEKDGLLKFLYEHFGLTTSREYLNSLLYLVEEPSISANTVVKLSRVLKFCYPFGYAFKVRTVLGSAFYRDKFVPTDSTEKLFKLVTTQMQDGLRRRLPISAQLKVINDVAIYVDKEKTIEIVKSSKRIMAELIDHGITVYAFSKYTDSMVAEYVEHQSNWPGKELGAEVVPPPKLKEAKPLPQAELAKARKEKGKREVEERKKETAIKKKSSSGETITEDISVSRPIDSFSPSTKASYPLNKREKMAADDPMVAAVMGSGTMTVKIPNAAPFIHPETEADTWPVVVMLKYLTMVIELPQYENDFLRCELSGSEFLSLNEMRMGALCISHKLHEVKLLAHVRKLKDKVFAKRMKQLSSELDRWHTGHVAAWLHVDINTPTCATSILRGKANGNVILDLYIDEDDTPLRNLLVKTSADEKEILVAMNAIKNKFHPHLCNENRSTALKESNGSEEVGVKKETAMAKKRRLKAEAKANAREAAEIEMGREQNDANVSSDGKFDVEEEDSIKEKDAFNEQESVDAPTAVDKDVVISQRDEEDKELEELSNEENDIDDQGSDAEKEEGTKGAASAIKENGKSIKESVKDAGDDSYEGDPQIDADKREDENPHLYEEGADKHQEQVAIAPSDASAKSGNASVDNKMKKKKKRKDHRSNAQASAGSSQQQHHHERHQDDSLYLEKIEELENVLSNKMEMEAQSVLTLKKTIDSMAREMKKKDDQKRKQDDMMTAQLKQLEINNKETVSMLQKVSKSYMEALEDQKSLMKRHEKDIAKATSVLEAASTAAVIEPPTAPTISLKSATFQATDDVGVIKPPLAPTVTNDASSISYNSLEKESEDLKDSSMLSDGPGHTKAVRAEEAKLKQEEERVLEAPKKKVSIASTPHQITAEHPMQLAQRKLNSPKFHVNISAAMKESFESEVDSWIELSDYYRLDAELVLGNEDSRGALTKIALLWTRLGAQMVVDAEAPVMSAPADITAVEGVVVSNPKTSSVASVNTAGSKQEYSGIGNSGSGTLWSPKFIPLLKGMMKCAEIALNDFMEGQKDVQASHPIAKYTPLETDLPIVMVYILGLVHKLIEKYTHGVIVGSTSEMHSTLVYLLNGIKMGTFPLTELSRDDLKTCLDVQLGLSFSGWDKYDSVCNLIGKGGFINFQNIMMSFRNLPPFSTWLDLEDAATVTMTLLSICAEVWLGDTNNESSITRETRTTLTVVQESFESAVMLLLIENKDHVQSFRALLSKDDRHVEPSMQLIADLLYDMARRFINNRCNIKYHPDSIHLSISKEPLIFENKKFSAIEFLEYNLKFACGHLARSLQIYDSESCLDDFGSLLVTHLRYRSMVLTEGKAKEMVAVKSLNKKQTKFYALKISNIEMATLNLISDSAISSGETTFSNSSHPMIINLTNLNDAEDVFSELLGIPVRSNGERNTHSYNDLGYRQLMKSQLYAELSILRKQAPGLKGHTDSTHHMGRVSGNELRSSYENTMKGLLSELKKSTKAEADTNEGDAAHKHNTSTSLIEEATERMLKQRLEVISDYLRILNDRAEGRQYALETLMHLRSTTRIDYIPETKTENSSNVIHLPPIAPIDKEEIMTKAKNVRLHLVEEIQASGGKEETKLSRRVDRIKEAIINGSIPDESGELSKAIREVGYLERMLLQCSKDILELSTRIIEKLKL